MEGLKEYIAEYLLAEVRPIDIWDIEIVCMPKNGCIKTIVAEGSKRVKKEKTTLNHATGETEVASSFSRKMANYCSIGIDARIGLGFDRNRTKYRLVNKLVYAWEGIKKFARPTMNLHNIIEKMENLESFERIEQPYAHDMSQSQYESQMSYPYAAGVNPWERRNSLSSQDDSSFMSHRDMGYHHQSSKDYPSYYHGTNKFSPSGRERAQRPTNPLKSSIYSLSHSHLPDGLMNGLRFPSFSSQHPISLQPSGVPLKFNSEPIYTGQTLPEEKVINGFKIKTSEIFKTGDHSNKTLMIAPINIIGLNIPSYGGGIANMWDKASQKAAVKAKEGHQVKPTTKQDMGDGELEFLSFKNNITFGIFERLLTGGGSRVAQGGGPFLITFKQSADPINDPLVTYAQVDGEYMQLINPMYYRIGLTPDLPNGKINGLFKKPSVS